MTQKKSMMFYYDWKDILMDSFHCDYEAIGKIVVALVNYGQCREMPMELSDTEMIAFYFMYGQVDRDSEKYMHMVEKNRANGIKSAEARKKNNDNF